MAWLHGSAAYSVLIAPMVLFTVAAMIAPAQEPKPALYRWADDATVLTCQRDEVGCVSDSRYIVVDDSHSVVTLGLSEWVTRHAAAPRGACRATRLPARARTDRSSRLRSLRPPGPPDHPAR